MLFHSFRPNPLQYFLVPDIEVENGEEEDDVEDEEEVIGFFDRWRRSNPRKFRHTSKECCSFIVFEVLGHLVNSATVYFCSKVVQSGIGLEH